GAQVREDLAARFLELLLDHRDFLVVADVERVRLGMFFQLLELGLQLGNRLLEVEMMFHGISIGAGRRVSNRAVAPLMYRRRIDGRDNLDAAADRDENTSDASRLLVYRPGAGIDGGGSCERVEHN